MGTIPVVHLTLYKHGVGFFERRARLAGETVALTFRRAEMNDVLKSLTAIDWGGGQVLGIEYATPESREERLSGCSIRLEDDRSLRDLLAGLRGQRVRLLLDQAEETVGTLVGLDEVAKRQPLSTSLVSLLADGQDRVQAVDLGRLQAVEILDERGAKDLRFFLQTALAQEETRQVTVRLTPGEHDLSVAYIAPAPTWRVSYRLVAEPEAEGGPKALLQGWGILDNRLDEDLEGISLSLVAGMPISFVYDLYTPFTPERPVVQEEARVAAAPVEFGEGMAALAAPELPPAMSRMAGLMAGAPMPGRALNASIAISAQALAKSAPVAATGEALGELFQYRIGTPVTVQRGHSAMVPIVASTLGFRKDLIFNSAKMPAHPVATLRLRNDSGLVLERGPVTVIEGSEYVGEAVLPFTTAGGEVVVPYAVELGIRAREETGARREIRGLSVRGAYLQVEEWDIRWRQVALAGNTGQAATVLVEHPRLAAYDLFESAKPVETAEGQWRFGVEVPARGEVTLKVQERRLLSRREELRQQSADALQQYMGRGLLDRATHGRLSELLQLWQQIATYERLLAEQDQERQKVYKAQQQIQGNMGALSTSGKEGTLRARYVEQLEASEEQLKTVDRRESDLKAEIERLKAEVEARLQVLSEA